VQYLGYLAGNDPALFTSKLVQRVSIDKSGRCRQAPPAGYRQRLY
jgi:hypothetical protein